METDTTKHAIRILTIAFLAFLATSSSALSSEKQVFAHYMVALPTAGPNSSVEDYKAEIQAAQKKRIDGFALNCGGWTAKEPHYKKRVLAMFQAAQELGTDFKLFLSADFMTDLTFDEVKDMVESFRDHPNQLQHDGKPVLSTFGGGPKLTSAVEAEFQDERKIFFVPFYFPVPPTELPSDAEIQSIVGANPSLDGFFYFGAAGTPEEICAVTRRAAKAWHAEGKLFMAPVTPYYRGKGPNNRVYEGSGFQGMDRQWQAAIESDADWVEIVTWNDFSESSYVVPFGLPRKGNVWRGDWGQVLSHSGYLDASQYYIEWFKTGTPPKITKDELHYFYRLHPKTLAVKNGRPKNADKLDDSIFVTVFLKEPAQLTIECAGATKEFDLPAGVSHAAAPLLVGQPRFTLMRDGRELISKEGEFPVSPENTWASFNYFTGSAVAEIKE